MAEFFAIEGNVIAAPSDLLLLKYAQNSYGADGMVSERLIAGRRCRAQDIQPEPGKCVLIDTYGTIAPKQVMFMGTPNLHAFDYDEMYVFARTAILNIKQLGLPVRDITTTIHGINCGYDAELSLENLVRGFRDELTRFESSTIESITFLTLDLRELRSLAAKLLTLNSAIE
jgi:hypothetical protein